MSRSGYGGRCLQLRGLLSVAILISLAPTHADAQQSSVSTWDAANFRIWGYIPYWDYTKVSSIAANGLYSHVSDVLFFGGARPDTTGTITNLYPVTTSTLRSQAATYGFKLHISMMGVSGSAGVDATWESIIGNPTYRTNFVNGVKALLQGGAGTADDMAGFNFDWERPSNSTEWGNYTELARELGDAIHPLGMEVSVCDFGSTDYSWDNTSLFDAKVYDQLFVMVYHIGATSTNTYVNQKTQLTQQGAAKAFSKDQIAVGVGTYGTDGPSVTLDAIVQADPNLAYDAGTYTGTLPTIGGSTATDTWTIESRKQVREKTQLALDGGMPGMFTWTLSYDSPGALGLHRVMHHYVVVKRDIPDLDLDGKVSATDAFKLSDNMGASLANTGMATAAQFDAFYLDGNWEKGDHDGNGFVNQADADWLAGRFASLGVNLPDRLAYTGTFEGFPSSLGINGRWTAVRSAQGKLIETGNFKQEVTNYLLWSGTGAGAATHSNAFVTIRNQNSAEVTAGINAQARMMEAKLATPMDLGQNQDTYVKFLVRENTGPLSAAQLASGSRTLSLDFLNNSGVSQFDIAFHGLQQQFSIDSVADVAGQDVTATAFSANATYLLIAKISGNGTGANTLQASLFPSGALVANFTDSGFQWMLTAQSSSGFNPLITDIRFTSNGVANYTVSNVWIGDAATLLPPTLTSQGDFNHDGHVDASDYVVWRKTLGKTGANLAADANGNYLVDAGDLMIWRANTGMSVTAGGGALGSGSSVPEPRALLLLMTGFIAAAVSPCFRSH
ncbi:MAG TPA: glycosyl hydrolase family 18 protein [Lacipirellulaceae bacterium]|nr:glycosyl hydrolase family 18 protein [Lacipirellulaceae bacterium]